MLILQKRESLIKTGNAEDSRNPRLSLFSPLDVIVYLILLLVANLNEQGSS